MEGLADYVRTRNLAGNARDYDITLWLATGMPASETARRSRLSCTGSETGAPSRPNWRVAGKVWTKPPTSESHPKATSKPHQSAIKAPSKPVDSQAIGTPRLPQGYPKATSKPP